MTHKWIRTGLLLLLPLLAACNLASTQNTTPTASQSNIPTNQDWAAYVYNNTADSLLRISADGTQTSYSLGLANSLSTSYELSFNEDGSRVAFCKMTYDRTSGVDAAQLIVRDLAAQTDVVDVDLGASAGKSCSLGRQAFANNRVAVAVLNDSPFDTTTDASLPTWQVMLLDATTGEIISQFDANSNLIQDDQRQGYQVPLIQHSDGTNIVLSFAPYGGEGPINLPSFMWHTDTGTVEAADYWGFAGVSALVDTGEFAFPANDPNLPTGTSVGPLGPYNVLQVVDGGAPRNIYHSVDWLVASARFINNGRQIAWLEYPSFDANQSSDSIPPSRWRAMDRAGNITEMVSSQFAAEVESAPDGYVLMEQDYPQGAYQQGHFTLRLVQNGVSTTLWETTSTDSSIWNLMGATPTITASDLAAFPSLAQ